MKNLTWSSYSLGKTLSLLSNCFLAPELEEYGDKLAVEANQICMELGLEFSFRFPSDPHEQKAYFQKTFGEEDAYIQEVWRTVRDNLGSRATAAFDIGFFLKTWEPNSGFTGLIRGPMTRHFQTLRVPAEIRDLFIDGANMDDYATAIGKLQAFLVKPRSVFISYRRDGGAPFARMLYIHLLYSGFDVFLDVETLGAVRSGPEIQTAIKRSDFFVLILTPSALERCSTEDDWLRREIEHSLELGKKIIPVLCEGFSWPAEASLPDPLRELPQYNGCHLSHTNFRGFAARLDEMLE